MQKDIDARPTDYRMAEAIALINSSITTDPNIIKLLKTK